MSAPVFHLEHVVIAGQSPQEALLVHFTIADDGTTPSEFVTALSLLPDVSGVRPVLFSGRGPIWGYGMLVHRAHATPAVALFDPRLDGFVIVESHASLFHVGEIIHLAPGDLS